MDTFVKYHKGELVEKGLHVWNSPQGWVAIHVSKFFSFYTHRQAWRQFSDWPGKHALSSSWLEQCFWFRAVTFPESFAPKAWTGEICSLRVSEEHVVSYTLCPRWSCGLFLSADDLCLLFQGSHFYRWCCCSAAQSYPTLGGPVDCSTLGFPILHYLWEFTQTHVHWVGDAIQPSHPLSPPCKEI